MRCPHAPEVDIGEQCSHSSCWLHHPRARGNCAATDTGGTHLVAADVARVHREGVPEAEARVERGRRKMAAWLALLERLDAVSPGAGCSRCCARRCRGGPRCDSDAALLAALRDGMPLESTTQMSATRWREVLRSARAGDAACTIVV